MRFILNTQFRLLAMMPNETGFKCRIYRQTTNWYIVVLCLIGLMRTITCNNPSCLNGDCDTVAKVLRHEKRLSIQQREYELIQKQKELQIQLQKLYAEQHQLDAEMRDSPELKAFTGVEYEIPSYCANCLGDSFEPSAKSSLSSEFSRKNSEETDTSSQQIPQLSDHSRLEAIKFQILLKLGLKNKPNVTSPLPKQFIFDTLRRSGDPALNMNDFPMYLQSSDSIETRDLVLDQLQQLKVNASESIVDELKAEETFKEHSVPEDDQEFDDFYGRTQEIITFAEKGHKLNGHHLLEFSTSIDNQTSMTFPKLKIRLATLWVRVSTFAVAPDDDDRDSSNDIVQLHHLSHRKVSGKHSSDVNTPLVKKSHNQSHRRRRKRKRKDDSAVESDSNMYYFENHSYNHITNDNNDGNHIIKPNRQANGRRKIKNFDSNDSNKFNQTSKARKDYHSHKNLTLWIFRIKKAIDKLNNTDNITDKEFDSLAELSATKVVHLHNAGWQKLDVTDVIQKWYKEDRKERRMQLFVECSGCSDKVQVHLFSEPGVVERGRRKPRDQSSGNNDVNRPFLVVHIEPNVVKRNRRRALDCSVATKTQCCKQRFYVSFKALGWDDWIIAPAGYYANYCSGSCGGGLNRTPDTFLTYYSHVFHEVRKYNKLNGNQLCCAPLKFSSMSLIYFGPDSKIIKRDLPKMVVDECGCP